MIWLSRRPGVKITAMAVILAGTGFVLSGAAPAAGRQLTRSSLGFTCGSPSASQRIPVQVAVSIPGTATAGQPIRPAAPAVTVTLPRAYGQQLAKVNASTVNVIAQLRSEVTENGRSVADRWLLKTVSAALPSRSDQPLHATGAVQPVTEPTAGNASFTAAGLSLLITPRTPSGAAATIPRTARLDCTLNPGQTPTLATVPVTAAAGPRILPPVTVGGHFVNKLWQATPGGNISGSGRGVALKDTATGTAITCKSSSLSGAVKFGQQLSPAGIGSISSLATQTCTGPGGRPFTITTSASASHPWLLNAQSWNPSTTVTTMTISGIRATISGPGCTATVAGPISTTSGTVNTAISVIFDVSTFVNTLSISPGGGTLHTWNINGCSGLFNGGDALTFTGTYTTPLTSPAQYIAPAYCPPFPVKTGFHFNPDLKLPKYPHHGAEIIKSPTPQQACAFIKGFSDVKKLNAATLVGPGFGNLQEGRRTVINPSAHNYTQIDSVGKLYYKPCPGTAPQCKPINGLPPVHATFLSFGFMPTTATLQITQSGTLDIASVSGEVNHQITLKFTRVQSLASIRVENVQVDGAPLNVGSDCRTSKPFLLSLIGKPPYQLVLGGVLRGTISVPPFTGCGVGENLDPIFTASVSGPGNYVQLTQGTLCVGWNGGFPGDCPAKVPKPIR